MKELSKDKLLLVEGGTANPFSFFTQNHLWMAYEIGAFLTGFEDGYNENKR